MLEVDLDHIDADGRAVLAADRNLRIVFANACAAERFRLSGEALDGLPLTALFGPSGAAEGPIGRAAIAAEPLVIFLPVADGEDRVRVDASPLSDGLTLLAIDADEAAADVPVRARIRALGALAAGFRDAVDGDGVAAVAERVVAETLGVRASLVPLLRTRTTPVRPGVASRRGPARRHPTLVVPDRVRAGEVIAVDDVRRPPPAFAEDAEAIRGRGAAAFLWVGLVREGSVVSAMLLEADTPRRWGGDVVALVASVLDRIDVVGARIEAVEATMAAEERLRVLVDSAAAAVWEAAADGTVVDASPSWCALTGQTADEMMCDGWMKAILPADRERTREAWADAVASGTPFDVEVRLAVEGPPRWMNLKAAPLREAGETVTGWVGMAIDISPRRAAEAEHHAGETRLRSLLEGIPQLVWRAAPGRGWTWSSTQWRHATGQSLADSLGNGWLDAVHPDDRAATMDAVNSATAEAPLSIEHRLFDASAGRFRWFQSRATPVVDASGAVVEWLGTSSDIDDLRRLEEDQRHFVAELQHRTRNLIAVVQSIVRQSLPRAASPAGFASALEGRLKSLARAQGVLSRGPRTPVTLGDLIRMEVEAVAGEASPRVTIEGPEVPLRRFAVQLLTLALHELAENARAHGALSVPAGTLSITWTVAERGGVPTVEILWDERFGTEREGAGGPGGYGRSLVEGALPYSLGAIVDLSIEPFGASCLISLPLADDRAPAAL